MGKVVKSDNKQPPFIALDLEHKAWSICFKGTQVIEQKPNTGKA